MGDKKRADNRTFMLTLTAMFAAVITVGSWISIPLPLTPIPANLGTLAVTLTGALLGWKYGSLSVIVYILLGAVGVPVFAGFTGGLGHIAGPTGGYIIGYITSALICGAIIDFFRSDKYAGSTRNTSSTRNTGSTNKGGGIKWYVTAVAAFLGTASCYIIGTIWFMILTGSNLATSLALCVIPFLPGDAFKIAAAVIAVPVLRKALARVI